MPLLQDHACLLCAGRETTLVATRDRDGKPLTNRLCQSCGLVFVAPPPTREALDAWYAQSYRLDYKGVITPRPMHVLRAGRVALDRISRIRPLLTGQPRTLDVGSGGGEMLYLLTHLAGARAEGLEPNEGYARHAREQLGLPVHQGFVERSADIRGGFDLITIYHVLEHLAQPAQALTILHDWLKPGGHLVVEVPNVEATCQAPAHSFHRAHLTTWGVPTLERLGLQAGLQPTRAWVSEDGGNIEVVFRRDTAAPSDATAPHSRTRDYAGKVEKILRSHTALGHYLSGQPLRRLAARLRKRTEERRLTRDAHDPRRILDNLIRQSGAAVSPATPTT